MTRLKVGDGPQRELLEHLVILNGLQNVFFFRGHRENVHAELQARRAFVSCPSSNSSDQGFDLFAYPTSGESVGWVILEAMAAGKAVVSTAVGSVPTLITHAFNGFLTQSTEAIELVEYVLTLMDSEQLRLSMGVRSRERAKRDFSHDGFIQAYHSMCARHARARGVSRANGHC
jgi:glycosyltransferase involved in cell wall biosynthesis